MQYFPFTFACLIISSSLEIKLNCEGIIDELSSVLYFLLMIQFPVSFQQFILHGNLCPPLRRLFTGYLRAVMSSTCRLHDVRFPHRASSQSFPQTPTDFSSVELQTVVLLCSIRCTDRLLNAKAAPHES